jgi:hypothetical protein
MVALGVVFRRAVALPAHGVAVGAQLSRMRVMTVAAGDALGEHAALEKGAVVVHLVAHLAVVPVQPLLEQRDEIAVADRASRRMVLRDLAAARVALCAGCDLAGRVARTAALGNTGVGIHGPGHVPALVVHDRQTLAWAIEALPVAFLARPGQVVRRRPVAGLATDVDLRPAGMETAGGRVIVLAQSGRMTVCAHEIPVLLQLRPVQRVAVADVLPRVEVEPALTAALLGSRVPGDTQGLQAPVRKLDQILLQRRDAEGVLDRKFGEPPIGSVCAHEELAVTAEERGGHAHVGESGVVEVAQHGALAGLGHRGGVLRALPGVELPRMTLPALGAADVVGTDHLGELLRTVRRAPGVVPNQVPAERSERQHGGDEDSPTAR